MKSMEVFKEIEDRDAWATIRGFVYQVDLTILRWLDLDDNEILELEKGEDIDIVSQNIQKQEYSRLLEQIKYRESNINLNRDYVLESFFNFFVHKSENPNHKLFFRFVSNTSIGIERPELFHDGKSGIEVWIALSKLNTLTSADNRYKIIKKYLHKKTIKQLKTYIIPKGKKEVLAKKQWNDFRLFLEEDDKFLEFISDFEWSLNNLDNNNVGGEIKNKLVEENTNLMTGDAEIIYSRLFLYIFKLLCNNGLKQLNKTALNEQISQPNLADSDQKLLDFLEVIINGLNDRVDKLEIDVIRHDKAIETLVNDVGLLSYSDKVFDYRLKNLSLEHPSLVKNGSLRKEKVQEVLSLFENYDWINFKGINGTGKSQLANLICLKFENHKWLDLSAYKNDLNLITPLIESFLSIISGCTIIHERNQWLNNVVQSIDNNIIIIINDLPITNNGDELSQLLIMLANSIKDSGIKLLTTSNFNIHSSVIQSLDSNLLKEYFDFDFIEDEIIEYFVNSGASAGILKYINLISAVSHGNPRIISSIIYHLRSINWGEGSGKLFDVLINNEFSSEILQDVQESIKKYITDKNSRELLYRLSLIHWDFKFEEVIAISSVNEKITHPKEKFNDLINIWIQEQSNKKFQVSPLIYEIAEDNLPQNVIRDVHLAYAKSILSTKVINQINASRSISSFIKGNDYNNAGGIVMHIYMSANNIDDIDLLKSWGIFYYWLDMEIPLEMDIVIRISIRTQQIRLLRILKEDPSKYYNYIEGYLKEEEISPSQKMFIHYACLSHFENKNIENFWFHFDEIIKNLDDLEDAFKEFTSGETLSNLLWFVVELLQDNENAQKWLDSIAFVNKKFGLNFFENDIAQIAIALISNNFVKSENLKEEKQKDWDNVITQLYSFSTYFRKNGFEILEAIVLKEIIGLTFDIKKEHSVALKETIVHSKRFKSSVAKYLLYENIGKFYYKAEKYRDSIVWLNKAVEIKCTNQSNFIDTLIYFSAAISKNDSNKSVKLCKWAVSLEKNKENFNELNYIQLLGELAISYWINGKFLESFNCFEESIIRLFKIKDNIFGKEWIGLFIKMGHLLGYISASVAKHETPKKLSDGGDYTVPYQGFLSFNTRDLSSIYDAKSDPLIMTHLAIFSEGVNDISKSYKWSIKAFDLARKNGDQGILQMITIVCSQYSLINFKLEEAFEWYLLTSVINAHAIGSTNEERYSNQHNLNLPEIFDSKPSEKWNEAENTMVSFAIIPMFIMVLNAHLKNEFDKEEQTEYFLSTIGKYVNESSNKRLWDTILELSNKILKKNISVNELEEMRSMFLEQELNNLYTICTLGIIYLSKDKVMTQIINIIPFIIKYHKSTRSIVKFIIVPFVRNRALFALNESFTGVKDDLKEIVSIIENIDSSNPNIIQLIIQPVVEELEINIKGNRRLWLYDFEDI